MNDLKFCALAIVFCVTLVLTNILSVKIFQLPFLNIALTGGDLLYPLCFLITDIVTEVWGKRRASFIVYAGFFTMLFMLGITQLFMRLTPHPFWVAPDNPFGFATVEEYQNAFVSVFHVGGYLVFASLTAFITSQLLDISLFQFFRNLTKGKHLWLRNNVSTTLSQLVDSVIFTSIYFFWGLGLEFAVCIQLFLYMYGFKLVLALVDTPLCYLGVTLLNGYGASRPSFRENASDQSAYPLSPHRLSP